MLTSAWGLTQNGWVICYVWSLFFYGIGVGGEYPMTATSGMENAVGSGKISTKEDRLHRGRKVTSAFLMQGWGQFFNQVLLILLLLCFHHGSGNPPYSAVATQWTYRISFAIPALGTLWLVYYRTYKMKAAGKQLAAAKRKSRVTGYDTESLRLTFTYFGPRLIATAGAWFANDVFFYGNKLFQSEFIKVITNDSNSIMPGWLYNLINVGVSLVGYYLACKKKKFFFFLFSFFPFLSSFPPSLSALSLLLFLHSHKLYTERKLNLSIPNRQQALRPQKDANNRLPHGLYPLHHPRLQIQILHQQRTHRRFPSNVLPLLLLQPIRSQRRNLPRRGRSIPDPNPRHSTRPIRRSRKTRRPTRRGDVQLHRHANEILRRPLVWPHGDDCNHPLFTGHDRFRFKRTGT